VSDFPSGPPDRDRRLRAALPWLVGSLLVLTVAIVGGLGAAYLVANMRAVPTPAAVITPTPRPSATPSPSPTPSLTPSPVVTPTVPLITASPTPSPSPLTHTVVRGESLSIIAAEYGVTVEAIIELNQLQNPNVIVPGQQLLIPAPEPPADQ